MKPGTTVLIVNANSGSGTRTSIKSYDTIVRVYQIVALISRVTFFCCALVPGMLALDLPTLNL